MRLFLPLSFLLMAMPAPPPTFAGELSIKAHVVVNADRVRFRDVVEGELPEALAETFLVKAPSLGAELRLDGKFVAARLARAADGELSIKTPERIVIKRAGQKLRWKELERAVEERIREQRPAEELKIRFRRARKDLLLPPGPVRVRVTETGNTTFSGRGSVPVRVRVGDSYDKTFFVDTFVDAPERVLIAKRTIHKGRVITRDDLEFKTYSPRRLRGRVLREPEEAVGKVARTAIASGQIIRGKLLRQESVIKRGDIVRLILNTPLLTLSTYAVALDGGSAGEVIAVRNLDTQVRVRGRVRDAHTVQVEAGP